MLKKGLTQIYTTKTDQLNFAPIGLSLRACGQGLRVLMVFLAPNEFADEATIAASLLAPNLSIDCSAVKNGRGAITDKSHSLLIAEAFKRLKMAALSGKFDMVILYGLHEILNRDLSSSNDILDLIKRKASCVELVLAGQDVSEEIINEADLVTKMVLQRSERVPDADRGLVEVITGNGKGKTTYCLGKAFLSSCKKIPTLILQTIKSPRRYGEVIAIEKLDYIDIKTMGKGFLHAKGAEFDKKHKDAAHRAWEKSLREIFSRQYGLVVLDEINIATHYGLINPERISEMLFLKPKNLNLLLSGRNAHPIVTASASRVIEMKEIKHPFKKGIKARKGIEF